MREIDDFDIAMKERHAAQQLADRADDIGDIEVARRDFMQHRGEEEKVVAVDEGHVQVSASCQCVFEFQRDIHPAESTPQNQYPRLLVRHKPSVKQTNSLRGLSPPVNEHLDRIDSIRLIPIRHRVPEAMIKALHIAVFPGTSKCDEERQRRRLSVDKDGDRAIKSSWHEQTWFENGKQRRGVSAGANEERLRLNSPRYEQAWFGGGGPD